MRKVLLGALLVVSESRSVNILVEIANTYEDNANYWVTNIYYGI